MYLLGRYENAQNEDDIILLMGNEPRTTIREMERGEMGTIHPPFFTTFSTSRLIDAGAISAAGTATVAMSQAPGRVIYPGQS